MKPQRWRLPWHGIARTDRAIVLALGLLATACVLPPVTLQRPSYDYLVSFDLTQSMDVPDVQWAGQPVSRLALAKATVRELLPRLPCGSRIGWAIFADYRSVPLMLPVEVCSHYEDLLVSLERIDGRMRWANASNIGKAVTWSVRSAGAVSDSTRVVFFTDGQESPPLRPGSQPPLGDITPGAVGGWLVGVGSETPQRIPKTSRDGQPAGFWAADEVVQRSDLPPGQSQEHLSRLQGEHLKSLAAMVGFGYHRLAGVDALADALMDPSVARLQPTPTDLRWVPASLGLLLLVWRFAPPWTWRRNRSAARG